MELDPIFKALADPTRRRLLEELDERDGQTLFELTVRLVSWHDGAPSRQALSKHLAILEAAGLIRVEWQWRSKHHFLERAPLQQMWKVWLRPLSEPSTKGEVNEDRRDERAGR
jgi:DNA-binding transcriptional ArsR family regulator